MRIQNRNSITHIKVCALGSPNAQDRPSRKMRETDKKAFLRHQNTICNQFMVLIRVRKATNEGKTSTKHLVVMKATHPRITQKHQRRTSHDQLTELERDTRVKPESILRTSTYTNELTNYSIGELHEFGVAHAIYLCDKKYDRQVIPLKGNKLESRDRNTGILLKRRKRTDGQ